MPLSTYQTLLTTSVSLLLKTTASLFLSIILIILAISVYRLFLHPLARVPGPRLAALSNIWHAYHARNGRMYQLGKTLHKRYGAVVRVGPDELWVDSGEGFRGVYGAGSGFEKSDFYLSTLLSKPTLTTSFNPLPTLELQSPDTLDLLSERHLPRYRLQRRLIGPTYQLSSLRKFEPQIDSVLDQAIAQLRSLKGQEVDLKEWMHIIAVECLGAVVLSWSPGYIKAGSDGGTSAQGYAGWKRKSVFGLFPGVTVLSFVDFWGVGKGVARWFSNAWGVTFPTPKNFKPFFTPVYQKSSKRIAAALREYNNPVLDLDPKAKPAKSKKNKPPKVKEAARPNDLLEDLIQLHLSKPDQFTETYLRRMATTNFGAGHETLCSALTASMAMIGTHEGVQDKIAEEVGTHLKESGSGTVPFDTTAKQLPFTLAAIKEAQRLHPVIAMSLSRTVPLGGPGVTLHGHYIPPGTTVGCNPVALHRNREIFGEDADVYEPGRWLSSSSSFNSNANNSTSNSSNSNSNSNANSSIPGSSNTTTNSIPAGSSNTNTNNTNTNTNTNTTTRTESDPDPDPDPKPKPKPTSKSDSTSTSDSTSEPTSSPDNDSQQPNQEEAEKKRLREMLHLNLTYGGGARTCPGRHLAELILWKVVPRLIGEFQIEITEVPEGGLEGEGVERYFMSMLTGVRVRFLERERERETGGC